VLTIGELRDLIKITGSTQVFAMSMWIVGSGDNHNVWNLVFSLCMSQCLGKVRDTARSLLHCSSFKHLLLWQPKPQAP